MDLEVIAKIAAGEMAGNRSYAYKSLGDKYYHGQRVARLALRLRQLLFPEMTDKDDVLTVAAWFHDICNSHDVPRKIHGEKGAALVRELIKDHCTATELDEICNMITVHDDRAAKQSSVLLKLHQDADHLDHFGTNAVRRTINDAAKLDQPMREAMRETKEHFREAKDAIWRIEVHFDLSRRVYDEKMAFFFEFAKRFETEMNGEIWNEAQLLAGWDGSI